MTELPQEGDVVLTPDYGEGIVEEILVPGTRDYTGPFYRADDTEIEDVPLLWVRTAIHRYRSYFLDELLNEEDFQA